jgi:AhpD family alkylhydroperoxidase
MPTSTIDIARLWPEGYRAMIALHKTVADAGIDPILTELVKVRASQLNGCSYCIDMHTKDARAIGVTEQRLYALSAWRETPFFTEPERAALALTETLTRRESPVPAATMAALREHFDEEAVAKLGMLVMLINGWNILGIFQQLPVGNYRPRAHAHA